MTTQENIIREDLIIRDHGATATLARVATGVGRVMGSFGKLGGYLRAGAGMVGLFKMGESVRDANQLYAAVNRVNAVTGYSAAKAHALFDAFELTGVSADKAERFMTRLAQKGKDPAKELMKMAKAAEHGQLAVGKLMKTARMSPADAGQMMQALKQGPDALRRIMQGTLKSGDLVDAQALNTWREMQQARREMKDAWDEVVGTLYKRLMPAATKFFRFVTEHMHQIVALAKVYAATMIASQISQRATGKGILGNVGGFLSNRFLGSQRLAGAVETTGKALHFGVGGANFGRAIADAAKIQQAQSAMGGFARTLSTLVGKISPAAGKFLTAGNGMSMLAQGAARFGPWGIVVAVALLVLYRAFKKVMDGSSELGRHIRKTLGEIWAKLTALFQRIVGIFQKLEPVFTILWDGIGKIADILLWIFDKWLEGLNLILRLVFTIAGVIKDVFTSPVWAASHLQRLWASNWENSDITTSLLPDKRSRQTDKGKNTNYNDFRGSTFNVTQQFAEGFDPGRVAVAFTERIAEMGERRLQSGFAPLYSVRGGRG